MKLKETCSLASLDTHEAEAVSTIDLWVVKAFEKALQREKRKKIFLFPHSMSSVNIWMASPPSPMPVFSISAPINQCYCFCHHGNWTCCISCRSGGVFHNSQTDGSRGCSRSASPPSAKSAPRKTQNHLCLSPPHHQHHTFVSPSSLPPPTAIIIGDYITTASVWAS